MLDELPLDVDSIEEHRCECDDDHLLVDLVNLRERLQYPRNNLVLDDLLLAVLPHREVRDGRDHIAEDLFLLLMVQQLE